jgi:hypothetical protein
MNRNHDSLTYLSDGRQEMKVLRMFTGRHWLSFGRVRDVAVHCRKFLKSQERGEVVIVEVVEK